MQVGNGHYIRTIVGMAGSKSTQTNLFNCFYTCFCSFIALSVIHHMVAHLILNFLVKSPG